MSTFGRRVHHIFIYVCVYTYTNTCTCVYIHPHPPRHIHRHFFLFFFLHTCIYMYNIYMPIDIYICMYIHIIDSFLIFFSSSEILRCFPHAQFCFSFVLAWKPRGEHTLLQWNASLIKFSTLFYHLDFCFRYAYTAYKHYFICIVLAVLWEWLLFIKKHYIHTPFILKIWMESKTLIYMSYLNIAFKIN